MLDVTEIQLTFLILAAVCATVISVVCVSLRPGSGRFLCQDCRFNNQSDCLKSERPYASVCTAYRKLEIQEEK